MDWSHPAVARTKGGEAAANTMRFAPDLAESHCAQATHLLTFEWDWAGAERGFKRSMELNPGYSQAGVWYNFFYRGILCGAWEEAIAACKEYQSRDPRSGYLAAMVALIYVMASDGPSSEEWVDLAHELAPDAFQTLWARQLFLMSIRDYPRAIDAAQTTLAASGRSSLVLAFLGTSLAESGDATGARATYDELRSRAVREYVSPISLAALSSALGDTDAAIAHCHEAFRLRDPGIWCWVRAFPGMHHLRTLPEFRRLAASSGLPGFQFGADG